jgi:hypothetical protein
MGEVDVLIPGYMVFEKELKRYNKDFLLREKHKNYFVLQHNVKELENDIEKLENSDQIHKEIEQLQKDKTKKRIFNQ